MAAEISLEEYLSLFGNPGIFQIFCAVGMIFVLQQWASIQQFNTIFSYVPEHQCKTPENWNFTGFLKVDECSISSYLPTNDSATPCVQGWQYFTLRGEIYPANEFNLVCDREYLLSLALTIPFIGIMLGGMIFGSLADKYGRKKLLCILAPLCTGLLLTNAYSPDIIAFITFRFLSGTVAQGLHTIAVSYLSELLRRRMRIVINLTFAFLCAIMLPFQMYLMYFFLNWRTQQIVMALFSLTSVFSSWFVPESANWLLGMGNVKKSETVLRKYARYNKLPVPENITEDLEIYSIEIREKQKNFEPMWEQTAKLFKNSTMRRIMISIMFTIFTASCSLNILNYSIGYLTGNIYINFLINGGIQSVIVLISMYTYSNFGRVKILFLNLFSSGLLGAGGFILNYYSYESFTLQFISIGMALLARNLIFVTTTTMFVYSSELIPTLLRSTGIGVVYAASQFGGGVSPQILYSLTHVWKPLPHIFSGVLCIIAAIVLSFLPETFRRQLPNTIEDVEILIGKRNAYTIDEESLLICKNGVVTSS